MLWQNKLFERPHSDQVSRKPQSKNFRRISKGPKTHEKAVLSVNNCMTKLKLTITMHIIFLSNYSMIMKRNVQIMVYTVVKLRMSKNYSGVVLAYGCNGCNPTHGFCQCTAFAPTVLKESNLPILKERV